MRIVQINAVYESGSTGKIVRDISEFLTLNGMENIVYAAECQTEQKSVRSIGNKLDHKFHALLSRLTGLQGYFSHGATRRLLRELEAFSPDVVHLHNIHSNYLNYRMLWNYLSDRKIAVVLTLHDCYMFTGKCTHFLRESCERWRENCGDCPRIKEDIPSFFFDRTDKMLADKMKWYESIESLAVIGVSRWITDVAKQSILSCAKRIETIYNWVDDSIYNDFFREGIGKNEKGKYVIISVASYWTREKGLNDIYRLAELIDEKFCIYLVGQCQEKKEVNNISYIGPITEPQRLAAYYADAMALFNPSLYETFGMVTAEALACGTPAIVYDSTANPELVDETCGFVEKPGDVSSVYGDICEIAEKGRMYYSEFCRRRVRDKFLMQRQLEKTMELYKAIRK